MKWHLEKITRTSASQPGHNNRSFCTRGTRINLTHWDRFISTLSQDDFISYRTTDSLKEKIAKLHNCESILITPGSDYAIRCFFDSIPAGETVCIPEYHFPMYKVYADLNELNLVYATKTDDYYGHKYAVLTNPHSPVGVANSPEIIRKIASNVEYLLVDEAYIDYCPECSSEHLATSDSNIVVTRSFSKGLSGAGARVGYAFGSKDIIEYMSKFRSMFELSGPSIKYAEYVLDNREYFLQYCKETVKERDLLCAYLSSINVPVISTVANWIHVEQTDLALELITSLYDVKLNTKLPGTDKNYIRLTIVPYMTDEIEEEYENNFAQR